MMEDWGNDSDEESEEGVIHNDRENSEAMIDENDEESSD
jgi:hypothetical protein